MMLVLYVVFSGYVCWLQGSWVLRVFSLGVGSLGLAGVFTLDFRFEFRCGLLLCSDCLDLLGCLVLTH